MTPHEEWLAEYWAKTAREYENQELISRKYGRLNDAVLFQEYAKSCREWHYGSSTVLTFLRGFKDDSGVTFG